MLRDFPPQPQNESTRRGNGHEPSSNIIEKKEVKPIEINVGDEICSIAFFPDGKHVVSGDDEGQIQRWGIENGRLPVGTLMIAGDCCVWSVAVSQDGKWIVSGTTDGQVTVWDAKSHEKVNEFRGHDRIVSAVDVTPDATKIVTGSYDTTVCVWSLATGERLLGPFRIENTRWGPSPVHAVKLSPSGRLFATATNFQETVRIYDIQDGRLVDFPVQVSFSVNQSLAWVGDNQHLFALSSEGDIHHLDMSTESTLHQWSVCSKGSQRRPSCIALASNGAFIAASNYTSVSFWDPTTHKQFGPVIHHPNRVDCMAISANFDLMMGGGTKLILWNLREILPSPYVDCDGHATAEAPPKKTVRFPCAQSEQSIEKIASLEKSVQELRSQLADSQSSASQMEDSLNETISSLRVDILSRKTYSNEKMAHLEEVVQVLRTDLADLQDKSSSLVQQLHSGLAKILTES